MGVVQSIKRRGSPVAFIPLLLMGKELTPQKLASRAIQMFYSDPADYDNLEAFHSEILSIFEIANSAFPGRHFEAPSRRQVEKAFTEWMKSSSDVEKEKIFMELLKNTKPGEIDNITLIVGLATPPFSMVAKRAGENVTPFKMIKNVPDALFVPTVTVLMLFSVKLVRKAMEKYGEEAEYKEKKREEKQKEERRKRR
ncbi:hypothetical protein CK203_041274 [Vitis vinifera]|uniref:Uncharacterized protein n=1 Tax=Vitis vinifera TaxID=29760 RepID=A0A438HJ79_VITVI|nr:hypothetical protein CK203_041274 [Vitis vinifera]